MIVALHGMPGHEGEQVAHDISEFKSEIILRGYMRPSVPIADRADAEKLFSKPIDMRFKFTYHDGTTYHYEYDRGTDETNP